MIKVKKAWREVEQDIVKACENLPPGIKLTQRVFGYEPSESDIVVPFRHGRGKMCALGVRILGANARLKIGEIIGAPDDWVIGFITGFDAPNNSIHFDLPNDWRAGYQAGRRVAKKFGFPKGKHL